MFYTYYQHCWHILISFTEVIHTIVIDMGKVDTSVGVLQNIPKRSASLQQHSSCRKYKSCLEQSFDIPPNIQYEP